MHLTLTHNHTLSLSLSLTLSSTSSPSERMALSPNGRFLTPLVTYIPAWILAFPLHLFRLLPLSWRKSFLRFYFQGRGHIPECIYNATLTLAQPTSVANTLELYYEEANTVIDLDLGKGLE